MESRLFFDLFCAEQILKRYDLEMDDIIEGLVDGGGDGGIDAIYCFLDERLLSEDNAADMIENLATRDSRERVPLELVMVQAKRTASFAGAALERFHSAARDLFELRQPLEALASTYNAGLLSCVSVFRSMLERHPTRIQRIVFRYCLATTGDREQVHPSVERKADAVKAQLGGQFDCEAHVDFVGAKELLRLAQEEPSPRLPLPLDSHISKGDQSFVCLTNLGDYYRFICNEDGTLRRSILEANVRDYQKDAPVNKAIAASLARRGEEDFWWLNNGITIVASASRYTGLALVLDAPKIVNGLQTSVEIHNYFTDNPSSIENEKRCLLVKVVGTVDEAQTDLIINATNSQTKIPVASLLASDPIHRHIETHLRSHGLYYDRRRNYYRNLGYPARNIVAIRYLAQAVMAILLREPDSARARPSTVLASDADLLRVFNVDYPIELYATCAHIMRAVDQFLRRRSPAVPQEDKTNLRFYLGMCSAFRALGRTAIEPADLRQPDLTVLTDDDELRVLLRRLRAALARHARTLGQPNRATVSKSRPFRDYVLRLAKNWVG